MNREILRGIDFWPPLKSETMAEILRPYNASNATPRSAGPGAPYLRHVIDYLRCGLGVGAISCF